VAVLWDKEKDGSPVHSVVFGPMMMMMMMMMEG
jgi:hypothetical protein